MVEKQEIRAQMRARLRGLAAPWKQEASSRIVERIAGLDLWKGSSRILLYAALGSEPNLDALWQPQHKEGRSFFLPALSPDGANLELCEVESLQDLAPGSFKFREPAPSLGRLRDVRLDLIILPGLAFSLDGMRMGRGRGHYDRLLASFAAVPKLGAAFDCQVFDRLPAEPHDQAVGHVVTEQRQIICERTNAAR